jgi:hypothetical protein
MLEREVMNMYGTEFYCLYRMDFFQFTQLYSCIFTASQDSNNDVFRLRQIAKICLSYSRLKLH